MQVTKETLSIERDSTVEKIKNLQDFCDSDNTAFMEMSFDAKSLLLHQIKILNQYSNSLNMLISILK
jgi:hypothetical protein